jgi:ATP-binding cassette, subfamily B, bacterial
MKNTFNPVSRILKLLSLEKKEISQIYFYAILYGIIMLAIPVGIQALISYAQTNTVSASVILLVISIVISVFVSGVLQINQMKIIEKIQQRIFVRYAFEFTNKIPRLNLSKIDNYYLPELVNRFFDTLTLQKTIAKLLLDFPLAIVQILFGLLLLAFYHPIFIAFGMILALVVFGILYFSGMRGLTTSIEESTHKYKVVAWLQEMARVIRSVKFSKSPDFALQKADGHITKYLHSRTSHFKVLLLQYKTLVGFKTLVTAAMLIVGSYLLVNQQLTVGQFIAAEIVILTILNSVEKIIGNLDSVYDVLTAIEKIELVTDKENEPQGAIEYNSINKGMNVRLQNLSFSYPDSAAILKDVSFNIQAGDKVCITGEEGSGKSTLLRLLAGVYNEFEGNILLDDLPVNNYNLLSLRLRVGLMISQQDIFEGTLLENIAMGLEPVDMQEILKLSKKVGLTDFISTLTNGFDTQLNTNGRKLPANVVRKILLLRAIINKPALLLLEEPWHGMEEQHQQQIKQFLLNEMNHTTLFIITHDEAFAKACDKIISFKNEQCFIDNGNPQIPGGGESV